LTDPAGNRAFYVFSSGRNSVFLQPLLKEGVCQCGQLSESHYYIPQKLPTFAFGKIRFPALPNSIKQTPQF
jgi:hypothetical protein